jgi:hypothetical protein
MEGLLTLLSNLFTLSAFGALLCQLWEVGELVLKGATPQRNDVLMGGVYVFAICLLLGFVFFVLSEAAAGV